MRAERGWRQGTPFLSQGKIFTCWGAGTAPHEVELTPSPIVVSVHSIQAKR